MEYSLILRIVYRWRWKWSIRARFMLPYCCSLFSLVNSSAFAGNSLRSYLLFWWVFEVVGMQTSPKDMYYSQRAIDQLIKERCKCLSHCVSCIGGKLFHSGWFYRSNSNIWFRKVKAQSTVLDCAWVAQERHGS
jgi:hypothetical protein